VGFFGFGGSPPRDVGEGDGSLDGAAYKALFDDLPDCLLLYDQSGRIVDATRSALELFGYSRDELAGLGLADLFPEEAGATIKAELRGIFSHRIARFELTCRKKSGQQFPAEISASRCRVAGEHLIQIIVRDVEETVKIVSYQREKDEITRAILGCALDSIISLDDRGTVLEFNPAAEKMFGYTRQEALGSPIADLVVPPSLREVYHRWLRDCAAGRGGKLFGRRFESVAMRRDGSEFPVELRVGEIRRRNSLTFTAYVSDISERKRYISRLAEEKAKLEAILSVTSDGIVVLAHDGAVAYINRSFEEMMGCVGLTVRGMPACDLAQRLRRLKPEPADAFDYALGVGGQGDHAGRPLYRRCRIEGVVPRTLRVSWRSYGAEADNPIGRLAIFRDVTWEDEVHRAKDDLIGNVSHELRTPLTSIQGFVQLLAGERAGSVSQKQRKILGMVGENVERLKHLVSDLLDVDRVSTAPLEIAPLDLAGLMAEVITVERPRAEAKGLAVALQGLASCRIHGDRDRLYQIFQNLLSNAIKYTPQGMVTVTIASESVGAVAVTVEDTGMGIPESELGRIFDRFFRSSAAYAAQTGGTGLGLAIVKALVERHGGRIEVKSVPNTGSCFRVILPVEVTDQPAPAPAGPADLLMPEVGS
jgi:PAS domain S-box-containing protein